MIFIILAFHLLFLHRLWRSFSQDPLLRSPTDYIASATPVFVASMLLEIIYLRLHAPSRQYRITDSLNSISTGALMTLSRKFVSFLPAIYPYALIYDHLAVTRAFEQPSLLGWLLALLGVDFCYYWLHRTGHTFRAFWASHGVHHSSEEYNLSTALRQSTVHGFFSWTYWLPLAFFLPPSLFVLHYQFNILYQFWIHTEVVGDLGPLEYVLNTPSQHRVHHGRNRYCIDKNYGGTLCIFDRLFGTFAREDPAEPPVYGLTHSLNTMNPITTNAEPYLQIVRDLFSTHQVPSAQYLAANKQHHHGDPPSKNHENSTKNKQIDDGVNDTTTSNDKTFSLSLAEKLRLLFNGPGYILGSGDNAYQHPIPEITPRSLQKYDPRTTTAVSCYLAAHLAWFLLAHSLVMASSYPSFIQFLVPSSHLILSTFALGLLIDRHRLSPWVEIFRLLIGIPMLSSFSYPFFLPVHLAIVGSSCLFVILHRHQLSKPLAKDEIGLAGCSDHID